MTRATIISVVLLLSSSPGWAQNAELELTEETLNRLTGRLGHLSDVGATQPTRAMGLPELFTECYGLGSIACPDLDSPSRPDRQSMALVFCRTVGGGFAIVPAGPTVLWQWWITDARYSITSSGMSFTATVRSLVADVAQAPVTRTVSASVRFDAQDNRIRIAIDPFTVPIQTVIDGRPFALTQVRVAELMSVSARIEPQTLVVPLPTGGSRNVSGRVTGLATQYLQDRLRINLDVVF